MINFLIDLLYPRRCPVCDDIVIPRGNLACSSCKGQLKYITEPRCKRCSKPVQLEEIEFCYDCHMKPFHYIQGMVLWEYDDIMKKSISNLNLKKKREYADFYIEEIIKNYGSWILEIGPDVLVPIPLHRSKHNKRGYNQAEILSHGISKHLKVPTLPHLLLRNKKTLPQKQLNDKERLKNLQKAFSFSSNEKSKFNKPIEKVMLVDDIYTTGSTIEACTNILLANGIKEVYFISLCIGKGF